MSASIVLWTAQSRYGRDEYQPYFALVERPLEVLHRRPDVREPAEVVLATRERRVHRQPVEREVDLGAGPLEPEPPDRVHRSDGSSRGSTSSRNVRRGSSAETTTGASYSVPSSSATPRTRPPSVTHGHDRRLEPDLRAERLRGPRQHLGEPAVAALVERPRAELAVVLAEQVVQQHEAAPLRVRPDLGPDDRRRGEIALEDVALEVVVEEVGRRPGQQPDRVVEHVLGQRLEPGAEPGEGQHLLGIVAEQVRRRRVQQRLERLQDLVHVVVEAVVRVRVVLRVARDLALVDAVVLPDQQVVAVLHRRERRAT